MRLKDFIDMYDNWNGITVANDDDLNLIAKCKTSFIAENKYLQNMEVVSFGFYDDELCVRVKQCDNHMKYRYEFEMDNDKFEKGDCYECPFSYIDYGDYDYDVHCVLNAKYYECPLEEVEE